MPKYNKKRGGQKKVPGPMGSRPPTDDENSASDNWSTASVVSDDSSWCESASVADDQDLEEGISNEQENFEDRLVECLEGLSSKSGPQRKNCLEGIRTAFSKKYLAEFLYKRKETVTDSLLRCIKKGKGEEQALAALGLSQLAIQLGGDLDTQFAHIQSTLTPIIVDDSASVKARAECAFCLAICCFLASEDSELTRNVMNCLEDVFKRYFIRPDGTLPHVSPDHSLLVNSALSAWCLLFTIMPAFIVQDNAEGYIGKFVGLLQSSDNELRITAGEAIALLYDMVRCSNDEFGLGDAATDSLCVQLKDLSTESAKHMAKKDRRTQRSSFRDILRTVQDGEFPTTTVKMGMESLLVEGWALKKQYDAFCQVLGSGINQHLMENVMLRDFFDLGPPLPVGVKPVKKMSKVERNFHNNMANKARTKARARSRDKRSAVIGF